MARPTPRDDSYPPTYCKTFVSLTADAVLSEQFTEAPYAASEVWVSVPASFAGGNFVFRTQGSTSDVTWPVPAVGATGGYSFGPIRMGIAEIDETTTDTLTIICFWQGGAT